MTDNDQPAYDMRQDDEGWTVYVTATGEPAQAYGEPQTGLDARDADELVTALNLVEEQKAKAVKN